MGILSIEQLNIHNVARISTERRHGRPDAPPPTDWSSQTSCSSCSWHLPVYCHCTRRGNVVLVDVPGKEGRSRVDGLEAPLGSLNGCRAGHWYMRTGDWGARKAMRQFYVDTWRQSLSLEGGDCEPVLYALAVTEEQYMEIV